jgi:hypothetical protein
LFSKFSFVSSQKRHFFDKLFGENIFKNSSIGSRSSIEDWLLAAAGDREPSIVVIDDDDLDDSLDVDDGNNSGFSGEFANRKFN